MFFTTELQMQDHHNSWRNMFEFQILLLSYALWIQDEKIVIYQ